MEARDAGPDVHVGEDVACHEDAVGLPSECDVARGVTGRVDDLETGHLVTLAEHAVDLAAGAGEEAVVEARDGVIGLALANEARVLSGIDVALAHPVGNAELLAE